MKIRLVEGDWAGVECDALILPLFQDDDWQSGLPSELDQKLGGLLTELRESEEWKGKPREFTVVYRPQGIKARRLVLIGVGARASHDLPSIRSLTIEAVRRVKGYNLKRVGIVRRSRSAAPAAAQAAVEGVILASYEGDDYKTSDKAKNFVDEILFITAEAVDREAVEAALVRGRILGDATNFARRLVNEPGNRVNPHKLGEEARSVGEKYGLDVDVLGEPEMEREGMHAALAVARGSDEPARFIVLKYQGAEDQSPPVVLIGKGVTFDSGGYSLKPAQSLEDMKTDKAGGCAVLAAVQAIAQLGIRKNVVALIPAVENMVSGRAQRPGDVIRSLSGKTIEVLNTDAEGRLILADAITYAQRFNPQAIVDIATLTGACVVALGHHRAGVFSNDEGLYSQLCQASEASGEKFWRLPLDPEYRLLLDSPIADLKNVGPRPGGAISAAKFLQEFVEDRAWCHIDIAGVDVYEKDTPLKGATGFGVRTLVELVARLAG